MWTLHNTLLRRDDPLGTGNCKATSVELQCFHSYYLVIRKHLCCLCTMWCKHNLVLFSKHLKVQDSVSFLLVPNTGNLATCLFSHILLLPVTIPHGAPSSFNNYLVCIWSFPPSSTNLSHTERTGSRLVLCISKGSTVAVQVVEN